MVSNDVYYYLVNVRQCEFIKFFMIYLLKRYRGFRFRNHFELWMWNHFIFDFDFKKYEAHNLSFIS